MKKNIYLVLGGFFVAAALAAGYLAFRLSNSSSDLSGSPAAADTVVFVHPTANTAANNTTKGMLDYLYTLSTKSTNKILSGQFGSFGDGEEPGLALTYQDEVFQATGKYPALTGMDYGAQNIVANGGDRTAFNQYIIDAWKKNQVVTLSWHSPSPWTTDTSFGSFNGSPGGALSQLTTTGNAAYTRWQSYLDNVATDLLKLKAQGVTVLWRPLHEMNGNWFWWGAASNPTDYKNMWIQMFNYFKARGLDNLLWVYSPNTGGNILTYYPGDAYVDIVGLDHYIRTPGATMDLTGYSELVGTNKPVALMEFGPLDPDNPVDPVPASMQYDWGKFITEIKQKYPKLVLFQAWEWVYRLGAHKNVATLINDSTVLTRDELPNWSSVTPTSTGVPTTTPTPTTTFISTTTPIPTVTPTPGGSSSIKVSGTTLVKPDGTRFVIKGMNLEMYRDQGCSYITDGQYPKRTQIASKMQTMGVNLVRVNYYAPYLNQSANNLKQFLDVMQELSNKGIYVMPSDHQFTGKSLSGRTAAFATFANIIAGVRTRGFESSLVMNPYNEPGPQDSQAAWVTAQKDTLNHLRNTLSFKGVVMLDFLSWAADFNASSAQQVMAYDATLLGGTSNVVFTNHWYPNISMSSVTNTINSSNTIPLAIGELGQINPGSSPVTLSYVKDVLAAVVNTGINKGHNGVMAWMWNWCDENSMTNDDFLTLNSYGNTYVTDYYNKVAGGPIITPTPTPTLTPTATVVPTGTVVPTPTTTVTPVPTGTQGFVTLSGKDLKYNGQTVYLRGTNFANINALKATRGTSGDWIWTSTANINDVSINEDDYKQLSSLGSNMARFGMSFSWWKENRTLFFQKMDQHVAWAKNWGIWLVFNMFTTPGNCYEGYSEYCGIWSNATEQQQLRDFWKDVADHYKNEPTVAGFDLLNEPTPTGAVGWSNGWYNLADTITAEIRKVNNNTLIIVESGSDAVFTRKLVGSGVVYSAHDYSPLSLSHCTYGSKNYTYPGYAPDWDNTSVLWSKEAFAGNGDPRADLRNKLPINWANQNNVHLYIGEWGPTDCFVGFQNYTQDRVDLYKTFGVSWAHYSWRAGKNYWGLYPDSGPFVAWYPGMLTAIQSGFVGMIKPNRGTNPTLTSTPSVIPTTITPTTTIPISGTPIPTPTTVPGAQTLKVSGSTLVQSNGTRFVVEGTNIELFRDSGCGFITDGQYEIRSQLATKLANTGLNALRVNYSTSYMNQNANNINKFLDVLQEFANKGMYVMPSDHQFTGESLSGRSSAFAIFQKIVNGARSRGFEQRLIMNPYNEPGPQDSQAAWVTAQKDTLTYLRNTLQFKGVVVLDFLSWAADFNANSAQQVMAHDATLLGTSNVVFSNHWYPNISQSSIDNTINNSGTIPVVIGEIGQINPGTTGIVLSYVQTALNSVVNTGINKGHNGVFAWMWNWCDENSMTNDDFLTLNSYGNTFVNYYYSKVNGGIVVPTIIQTPTPTPTLRPSNTPTIIPTASQPTPTATIPISGTPIPTPTGTYIYKFRFLPRFEYGERMVGGKFQGSNTGENSGYVDLYTIPSNPDDWRWNEVVVGANTSYRYLRYIQPSWGYGTVADLEFFVNGVKKTGTTIGSDASRINAFDNNSSTYFQGTNPYNQYVGLDTQVGGGLPTPTPTTTRTPTPTPSATSRTYKIRFYARFEYGERMIGAKFQGSNTSDSAGFEDIYTIPSNPDDWRWNEVTVTTNKTYRYLRYIQPEWGYGTVAEVEFYVNGQKLSGSVFGSHTSKGNAFDGNTKTYFQGTQAKGQYVGIDTGTTAFAQLILNNGILGISALVPDITSFAAILSAGIGLFTILGVTVVLFLRRMA